MKLIYGIITVLLLVASAHAQSVQQSGSITPNHVPRWVSTGVIGDGGTAADSPITSFGVTSNTTAGICVSSGRSTAAGRQQLCLGAPLASNAVISLQNYGTAPANGLDFIINGVTASIPAGGGDFLTGTGPYVAGGVPCFTSTTSAVTDCGLVLSAGTVTTGVWQGTPVALGFGGTGGTSASTARTNLGLGTIATQNASAIAVTGGTITGMPLPTLSTDVASKAYVDSFSSGLTIYAPSALATAAVLPNTPTYANGALGVGATLTAGSNTTLTVDGTAAPLNTVVLVKTQAAPAQNGIYTVTTAGGGVPWVLTRATYFDQAAEMRAGSYTFITSGATNINTSWTLQAAVTTVGTDPLSFTQFSSTGTGVTNVTIAAGTGLSVAGGCAIVTTGTCTVSLINPVTPATGGTGVNNGSNTLTLAANLTQAGAFATTVTSTAISNATLPAGTTTLAALNLTQVFTQQQAFSNNLMVSGTGIYTTLSAELLGVRFQGASQYGILLDEATGTTSAAYLVFTRLVGQPAAAQIGSITQNASATGVLYNTVSDMRRKEDLKPILNARDKIAAVTAYDFQWKGTSIRDQGFMAQEAYKVIPECVTVGGSDPQMKPWQMHYSCLTPMLWANAQDSNARIDALEKEILELKDRGARVRYGLH